MSDEEVKSAKDGKFVAQDAESSRNSEEIAPPPDGGWGWVIVAASFVINGITDGLTFSFGVFYSEFLTYFGQGTGKTAWIVSILVGVTLCSGPLTSSFVNRWGCRAVTITGGILAGLAVIASALAENILTLVFTIGVATGFGLGLVYLPAIVIVTVWFEKRRSLATGIAVCGSGFGTFFFAPFILASIEKYGWRGAMILVGALVFNCVPMGMLFRPVPKVRRSVTKPISRILSKTLQIKSQSSADIVEQEASGHAMKLTLSQPELNERRLSQSKLNSSIRLNPEVITFRRSFIMTPQSNKAEDERTSSLLPCFAEFKQIFDILDLKLLVDPIFLLFTVSNFLTSVGFYIPFVYIVPMSEKMGISKENSAFLVSVIGIANIIGRLALGFIADLPWVNRLFAYNWCLTIAGIATILAMACWEFWGLAVYCTIYGITIGAYVGLTSVVLVDLLGLEKLNDGFGLLLLFQGIASLIGSPYAGFLHDELHSFKPGFYMAGGAIAISGIMLFFVPMLERRKVTFS